MPESSAGSMDQTLAEVRDQLVSDLRELFGHAGVEGTVAREPPVQLTVEGEEGWFRMRWPPGEDLVEAEGRLGAHGRIALEFLLASERPETFFEGYRPQPEERRVLFWDTLEAYIDDSLRENPYYTPLVTERRGSAMLVYGDDEYTLVADDGSYRGNGILHWKVKRLVAWALTDVDEAWLSNDETGE